MKKSFFRAFVEMSFIIFLFYSNLLMGEFTNNGFGRKRGLIWAIEDIFTLSNFFIAIIAAFIAFNVFEFFRRKY
jgi:hypothetical protein